MKRALLVVLLAVACSSDPKPVATPTPTPSPTPSPSAAPSRTATPAPTPAATPLPGPTGGPVPSGFAARSATFVSERTGWVLGASGGKVVVARTRDGGRTWRAFPGPAARPDDVSRVRFADLRDGFVTGAHLWATHDGGATWEVVPGLDGAFDLEADAGRVWAAREDGLRSAPAAGGAWTLEHRGHVGAIALHGDRVWVSDESAHLLTGRHGAALQRLDGPCASDDLSAATAVSPGGRLFVLCLGDGAAGSQGVQAFTSSSGGSWSALPEPAQVAPVAHADTGEVRVVFGNREVQRLQGGAWRDVLRLSGLQDGGMTTASQGFVLGSFDDGSAPTFRMTRDAGLTWTPVAFS